MVGLGLVSGRGCGLFGIAFDWSGVWPPVDLIVCIC
jgi:hypothetical protein